jgi:DNA-directed RNA polymerase subunit K/omega
MEGLTHYELARLVGERARQLEANAAPMVCVPSGLHCPIEIACLELAAGRLTGRLVQPFYGPLACAAPVEEGPAPKRARRQPRL